MSSLSESNNFDHTTVGLRAPAGARWPLLAPAGTKPHDSVALLVLWANFIWTDSSGLEPGNPSSHRFVAANGFYLEAVSYWDGQIIIPISLYSTQTFILWLSVHHGDAADLWLSMYHGDAAELIHALNSPADINVWFPVIFMSFIILIRIWFWCISTETLHHFLLNSLWESIHTVIAIHCLICRSSAENRGSGVVSERLG